MPKRKTQKEFIKEVEKIFGNEYQVLGEYINNKTNILIKHNKCGNTFNKIPKDMTTKKSGCPFCNGNKNKLYNENWVKNNTPTPYHYISGYINMTEKCLFHCDECNTDFYQSPKRLINQKIYGCNCCITKKKTQEWLITQMEDAKDEYEVLDEYVNIDTPLEFVHKKCNTHFKLSPYKFFHRYNKKYCPVCYYNKSHGEIQIAAYLSKESIPYKKEYIFKELQGKRFDFYLPTLNICIEFDGKQHFESIDFFGGEEALKSLQKNDQEKNSFCLKNNIVLFRIPYTDLENIDIILNNILKEKSSETIEKYKIY